MKANLSVLLTELSGSAGPVVASKWKGRQYFRAKVTPANPNTAAQQLVRESMARCVTLWQSDVAKVKASWGVWASSLAISGFNYFVKANRATEQATWMEAYTPPTSTRGPVTTVAGSTGVASGEIDLTWVQGTATGTDIMHVAVREDGTDAWVVALDSVTVVTDLAYTVTGLTAGTVYQVAVTNRNATDLFAPSSVVQATSGA